MAPIEGFELLILADHSECRGCRQGGRGFSIGIEVAFAIIAPSIVVGVYLIEKRLNSKRLFREWDQNCAPQENAGRKPGVNEAIFQFAGIALGNSGSGRTIGANFSF